VHIGYDKLIEIDSRDMRVIDFERNLRDFNLNCYSLKKDILKRYLHVYYVN